MSVYKARVCPALGYIRQTYIVFVCCSQTFYYLWYIYSIVLYFQTLPLLASIIFSLVFYIIFALVYNIFVRPNWGIKDSPNLIAERSLSDPIFWLCLLFAAVLALLPRFV